MSDPAGMIRGMRAATLTADVESEDGLDVAARVCDYDHILNHREGGATDSRNGHRLCRYHHRAKTFTDWHVTSPAPGVWVWTSPDGRVYLVTGGTTTRLSGRVPDTHQRRRKPHAA